MGEHWVRDGDETTRSRPWVVVLTSHQPYHAVAAWLIDEGERSEEVARRFATFVTAELDPAVALPLRSPTVELLSWRHMELNPDEHVPAPDADLLAEFAFRRGIDVGDDG
jgi:hypothetical protein